MFVAATLTGKLLARSRDARARGAFFASPQRRSVDGTWVALTHDGTLITSDAVPLYVRLGDWVGVLVVIFTLSGAAYLIKRRFRP